MTNPGEHLDKSTMPSSELVKMVRKLRWIGMEEEARRLQTALSAFPSNERGTILADSNNTD